jgi:ABC-2 type transport system permease protein
MNAFLAAFWAESLKARRSKITLLTTLGFLILPLAGGFFMIILKDPEAARSMGLISTKAQLTAGTADWPSFFSIISQGTAAGGVILFSLITSWVFGREWSDHTAKELMALATPRWTIVAAKFALMALWFLLITLLLYVVGLVVGVAVNIPGWSSDMAWSSFWIVLTSTLLTFMLMPYVALFASSGRGFLPPMGWTILALAFANLVSVLGWGDWFPWAIPVLLSGMVKTHAEMVGVHSYVIVALVGLAGFAATFAWWQSADQTR